jgi:hypothetical protein
MEEPFSLPRCSEWQEHVKLYFKGGLNGCEDVEWIHLAQDMAQLRIHVKTAMNIHFRMASVTEGILVHNIKCLFM